MIFLNKDFSIYKKKEMNHKNMKNLKVKAIMGQ